MALTRPIRVALCAGLMAPCGARLAAQGVTGAAVQGMVMSADSAPVAEATVLVTNTSTGERWRTVTQGNGRFYLELSVGGPYTLDVRAIGFTPAERSGIVLSLGQRLSFDVSLVPTAFQLEELSVRGVVDSRINAARTGPALTVSGETSSHLPVRERDFANLARLSPQVSVSPNGGLSFGGQHDRLNSLQVDGTTSNDVRGGVGGGIYGIPLAGQNFGNFPLTPEGIEELQVLTAPFDVRYGNFVGGLVNAVSKSGTNRWEGSVYSYFQNEKLAGTNPDGTRADPYSRGELGLSLGGPIVRDRLAFYINAGGRRQDFPQTGLVPSPDTTGGADSAGVGVRYASVIRFRDILRNTYGVDPGTFQPMSGRVPVRTLFAKLSAQLGVNSRLEVSHNYLYDGARFVGNHFYGTVGFSTNGSYDPEVKNVTRVTWQTAVGSRWSNELFVARNAQRHHCVAITQFPLIDVSVDNGGIEAGQQFVCAGQDNRSSIWELTDNLGLTAGSHHLTFGTHNELVRVSDNGGGLGVPPVTHWHFSSLDSLEQGLPEVYERFVPGPLLPPGGTVQFRGVQTGFYVQDQWSATRRLTLTGGLRFDVPYLPTRPALNQDLLDSLGIDTRLTPNGHLLWSPRLGINYDVSGNGSTFLRGGLGLFAGRPPYQWLEDAWGQNGLQVLFLQCFDQDVPAFTVDPFAQPTQCGNGDLPVPDITVFDSRFRYPRSLKIALGADRRFPWNMIGTVDFLYTRGVDQFVLRDINLLPASAFSRGEANRPLYGTVDQDGISEPFRRNPFFEQVAQITNGSGDRAYSLAFQLQKRFGNGSELSAAYTYTSATDRESAPANVSRENLGMTPLDGTWETRNTRTSLWSRPHKVTLMGTAILPLGVRLGMWYEGTSGAPFTYVVLGDANRDSFGRFGLANNDPVYIPRDAGDITLADPAGYPILEQAIQADPCLRSQRGHLVQRNSCRNPWEGELDARVSKAFPTFHGHEVEITADIFNLPNFLDRDWGRRYRTTDDEGNVSNGERVLLLELVGYDDANGRGVYNVIPPRIRDLDVDATRWKVQLSARYTF